MALGILVLLDFIEIQAIAVVAAIVLLYIEAKRANGKPNILPT
jgi:hypothetical protein